MRIHSYLLAAAVSLGTLSTAAAQSSAELTVNADKGEYTISKHIYGHFAEHLGRCIYDGLWVGENSSIPNINGVRTDIIEALKDINIPNLRWPGGCFADEYHWMDGIGPRESRAKMINTHWGGVVEDNSFGTHEFLNLCEVLGTEPYICGNVGSGSVEEMSKWVEYITFDGESPMANLRRENGREEPWRVKYWGVGNENWGCGGNMTAEYYAGEYRRYATYSRNYGDNKLYKVVGGPNSGDYHWMEVMMKDIPTGQKNGVSLHNYTLPTGNWNKKGSSTEFDENEYYTTITSAFYMDELITKHSAIMDKYDRNKRIGLIVDEWGTWYDVEPGTNPGFLYQQNTLRDAIVAGIHLNIFHNHADRVHMANIAQLVNVLQALFLTDGEKMLKTPTYHVFDMFKVHQEATMLPIYLKTEHLKDVKGREYTQINASASMDKDGNINISIVNSDLKNDVDISCAINGFNAKKVSAKIITSEKINDYNSFENPEKIVVYDFDGAKIKGNKLSVKIPAMSVVTIALNK
ncbi:MAG: alpha-N-arabinofuranosidase [Rikenellaceae bacterium]|nr:alpha-N-arabinofuranosidase [Rikenellaceae bacterium]